MKPATRGRACEQPMRRRAMHRLAKGAELARARKASAVAMTHGRFAGGEKIERRAHSARALRRLALPLPGCPATRGISRGAKLVHVTSTTPSWAATTRRTSASSRMRRSFCSSCCGGRKADADRRAAWHAESAVEGGMENTSGPIRDARLADPPERIVAIAARCCRRGDHLARLRHPPQLVHAVLGGAPAADHAEHLGYSAWASGRARS